MSYDDTFHVCNCSKHAKDEHMFSATMLRHLTHRLYVTCSMCADGDWAAAGIA